MGVRQALVVGFALVALAGCGGGDEGKAVTSPSAAASFAASGTEINYLKVLRGLDADLVDDERGAVDKGHVTCEEIGRGQTMAQLTKSAASRFDTDAETAQRIVVVARSNFCKA